VDQILPPPPTHGLGRLENRSNERVLSTPVGGHYTDNPYRRYSTTWDPIVSAPQVQVDGSADNYVLSDDEEESRRGGSAAAGGGVLAALGGKAGRPAASYSAGAAKGGAGVERGVLLAGSDGGSGHMNGG
jgi:hypothetical protein